MRTRGLFVNGTGVCVGDRMAVADAVAAGLYDAEDAEAAGFVSIAVAGDVPAVDLALDAARGALERCGVPAASLGYLFYADVFHCGPDGWLPYSYLQRQLGAGHAFATGVRQGCNGVFGALTLADAVLRAAPAGQAALLVSADNFSSPSFDRWGCNPGLVMADGAGALVLSREPGVAEMLSVGSVTLPELEGMHRGDRPLHPADAALGLPPDFDARFAEFAAAGGLGPGSGLAFVQRFVEFVDGLLEEACIESHQLVRVLFNHAGREIVRDRLGPLGVKLDDTTWEFGSTIGHVGAADHIIAFDHLLTTGAVGAGDHLLLLGVGPGVNLAGAVLRVL